MAIIKSPNGTAMSENEINKVFSALKVSGQTVNWIEELAKDCELYTDSDGDYWIAEASICIRNKQAAPNEYGHSSPKGAVLFVNSDIGVQARIGQFEYKHKDKNTSYFYTDSRKLMFLLCEHPNAPIGNGGGCYVATCVYGSYDSPEVRILRRYRDDTLSKTKLGMLFIQMYYALSPFAVHYFGKSKWFNALGKIFLDNLISRLRNKSINDSPYADK